MVEAFRELLPAVTMLVSHHFRRVLLEVAERHIEVPDDRRPGGGRPPHGDVTARPVPRCRRARRRRRSVRRLFDTIGPATTS